MHPPDNEPDTKCSFNTVIFHSNALNERADSAIAQLSRTWVTAVRVRHLPFYQPPTIPTCDAPLRIRITANKLPFLVRIYEFWWQWEEVELMLLFLLIFMPTALFILALLPSMSLHRLKLMGVAFGIPLVLFISLLLPVIPPFLALPISSLVIYFWLRREGRKLPTYWQCLTFSLLFGLMFAAVSLIIIDTFLLSSM